MSSEAPTAPLSQPGNPEIMTEAVICAVLHNASSELHALIINEFKTPDTRLEAADVKDNIFKAQGQAPLCDISRAYYHRKLKAEALSGRGILTVDNSEGVDVYQFTASGFWLARPVVRRFLRWGYEYNTPLASPFGEPRVTADGHCPSVLNRLAVLATSVAQKSFGSHEVLGVNEGALKERSIGRICGKLVASKLLINVPPRGKQSQKRKIYAVHPEKREAIEELFGLYNAMINFKPDFYDQNDPILDKLLNDPEIVKLLVKRSAHASTRIDDATKEPAVPKQLHHKALSAARDRQARLQARQALSQVADHSENQN